MKYAQYVHQLNNHKLLRELQAQRVIADNLGNTLDKLTKGHLRKRAHSDYSRAKGKVAQLLNEAIKRGLVDTQSQV